MIPVILGHITHHINDKVTKVRLLLVLGSRLGWLVHTLSLGFTGN